MLNISIITSALLAEALAGGARTSPLYSNSFSEVPVFQLERHRRTGAEIELRAEEAINAFSEFEIELDEDVLEEWAQEAVLKSDRFVWSRPVVDHPNIVVGYMRQYDDVFILDTYLPDLERYVGPAGPVTDIGEMAAYDVFEDALGELQARSIVDECMDPTQATVGYVREWVQAQSQAVSWVSEYQFTVNCEIEGFALLDAGLRLSVHRTGHITSLRVTDIIHSVVDRPSTTQTWAQAADRLAKHLGDTYEDATAQHTILARPAAILPHPAAFGSAEGGYIENYSMEFLGGRSRAHLAHVSLVNGTVTDSVPF